MNINLVCSAHNCTYNTGGECFAGKIKVEGEQATTTSTTFCATYQSRDKYSYTNAAYWGSSVSTNDIHCEAHKCKYNHSELCNAHSVKINDHNGSCETFQLM